MKFTAAMIEWRGPAPFYFVPVPEKDGALIKDSAALLTYGWGVIPVRGKVGGSSFTTSLIPRNGVYLVPIKKAVYLVENLTVGDLVTVELDLNL